MKKLITIIIIALLFPVSGFADTHAAADCERATVAAAIAAAEAGDTVTIPAGTCTWATPINITIGGLIIQGAGKTQTTIKDAAFTFNVGLTNWRITAINFEPTTKPDTSNFAISVGDVIHSGYDSNTGIRIDNCEFDGYKWGIFGANALRGVIDSNSFIDGGIQLYGQDNEWAEVAGVGGEDFIFIENNTFNSSATQMIHAVLLYAGAKAVIRYNNYTSAGGASYISDAIDFHGYGHGADRSTRAWEVYNNLFTTNGSETRGVIPRGGSGVIYNNLFNQINNTYSAGEVYFWEFRQYSAINYGPTGGTSAGCNTPTSGVTGYCSANEGEPCCDMVGRGVDQASDPAYVWGNYKCTTAPCLSNKAAINATVSADSTTYIEANEDFYNSAKSGYTPYTCPHPTTGLTGKYCDDTQYGTGGYGLDSDYALTVTKAGSGTGTVTSSPSGINCGATCEFSYESGTVTLTATATSPSYFVGWSGEGCSGTSTCEVTMSAARGVTATFSRYGVGTIGAGGQITFGSGGSMTLQ